MFYLVCFDIVDDRARYRVVKVLKGYGIRVQKSVFECPNLTEHRFLKMKNALEKEMDHLEDTIRYYPLCRGCLRGVEYSGVGRPPHTEKFSVT